MSCTYHMIGMYPVCEPLPPCKPYSPLSAVTTELGKERQEL